MLIPVVRATRHLRPSPHFQWLKCSSKTMQHAKISAGAFNFDLKFHFAPRSLSEIVLIFFSLACRFSLDIAVA